MLKKRRTHHREGKGLSIVEIEASHCFCCGVEIPNKTPRDERTRHYVIPKEMKSVRNIIVPVCKSCYKKLNHIHNGGKINGIKD